jgi:hypothetical protein
MLSINQQVKFESVRAFARGMMDAGHSCHAFVASRTKEKMLSLANVLANVNVSDVDSDSVKFAAYVSSGTDLQNLYKAAAKKTVKETNSEDKAFRIRYEKLVLRYGKEQADAIIEHANQRTEKLLEIAKRES